MPDENFVQSKNFCFPPNYFFIFTCFIIFGDICKSLNGVFGWRTYYKPLPNYATVVIRGLPLGHMTYFSLLRSPTYLRNVYRRRRRRIRDVSQCQRPTLAVCAVHSMQSLPNYFGLLFILASDTTKQMKHDGDV